MSLNLRRKRHFNRKFALYILALGILVFFSFLLNIFFTSRKPLFISPIGRINIDLVFVEKKLKDNNILFTKVVFSENSYLINIQNNGQVRLSQNKDIDKQVSSLQKILRELTIEGKPFKSIDFRFLEPIISF